MKTKRSIAKLVLTFTHSKWVPSAALTLVAIILLAGITGCQPPHH